MSMDVGFLRWLNQTATISPWIKQDGSGDAEYGPSFTAKCFDSGGGFRAIINRAGVEVVSRKSIYFDGLTPLQTLDLLTLEGETYPIMEIIPYYDEKGNLFMSEAFM